MNPLGFPDWMQSASCAQLPVEVVDELFFDELGNRGRQQKAKDICKGCDVWVDCWDYATANRIPEGVFAGEAGYERRARLELTLLGNPTAA